MNWGRELFRFGFNVGCWTSLGQASDNSGVVCCEVWLASVLPRLEKGRRVQVAHFENSSPREAGVGGGSRLQHHLFISCLISSLF